LSIRPTCEPQQCLSVAGLGPLIESAADGAVGAARCRDPFVATAVDHRGDHVIEHDPITDPATVTTPRMRRIELGPLR
jgi:hypothetical protein